MALTLLNSYRFMAWDESGSTPTLPVAGAPSDPVYESRSLDAGRLERVTITTSLAPGAQWGVQSIINGVSIQSLGGAGPGPVTLTFATAYAAGARRALAFFMVVPLLATVVVDMHAEWVKT